MKSSIRRHLRLGLGLFFVVVIFWTAKRTMAAEGHTPFEGEKTTWHGDSTVTTSSWTMPPGRSRR
jgi:hypothetical protein